MNIYEIVFLLQFIIAIGITLTRVYNVMNLSAVFDLKTSWMLFIGFFITYGVGFVSLMFNPEDLFIVQLLRLETWFILLNVVLHIVDLFINYIKLPNRGIQAYKSNEFR